jgi:uncharacterized protein (TIGR03086 family)
MDLLDLFERGSDWTGSKVPAASKQLDAKTPCEDWQVRDLLNHMIETQQFFCGSARGKEVSPPSPNPPSLIGDDPVATFKATTQETLQAFKEPGVIEKTGPSLGIAFCDTLIHGADLASATGQDATMPDDLAQAALSMLDGRLTPDRRGDAFKPEIDVDSSASAQERLLAYTGRRP